MNYDEMPAGTYIDLTVGKVVMGWRPHYVGAGQMDGWDIEDGRRSDWAPSTNIAHAWGVVEKMPPARGPRCDPFTIMRTGDEWTAGYLEDDAFGNDSATAPTAPLAICRACLKAMKGVGE